MQGEPGADRLLDLQPDAVVNAVNAAEVVAKLVSRGVPAGEAQAAYDALHLETTPLEPGAARRRGEPGKQQREAPEQPVTDGT
jgi:PIN domain nuclease of toxin-antitoxin system